MADNSRGFAAMDESKQREIARKGGKASGSKRSARSSGGAAGSTSAASKGGQNSHRNS